jgi:hypothetical protein
MAQFLLCASLTCACRQVYGVVQQRSYLQRSDVDADITSSFRRAASFQRGANFNFLPARQDAISQAAAAAAATESRGPLFPSIQHQSITRAIHTNKLNHSSLLKTPTSCDFAFVICEQREREINYIQCRGEAQNKKSLTPAAGMGKNVDFSDFSGNSRFLRKW